MAGDHDAITFPGHRKRLDGVAEGACGILLPGSDGITADMGSSLIADGGIRCKALDDSFGVPLAVGGKIFGNALGQVDCNMGSPSRAAMFRRLLAAGLCLQFSDGPLI